MVKSKNSNWREMYFLLILILAVSCTNAVESQTPIATAIPIREANTSTHEPTITSTSTDTATPEPTETLVPSPTPTATQHPQRVKPEIGVDAEDLTGLMYVLQLFVNDKLGTEGSELLKMTWEADEAYCQSEIIKPLYLFDDDGVNTGKCVKISDMCFDEADWPENQINPLPCNATMAVVDNRVPYPKVGMASDLYLFGVENDLGRYNTDDTGVSFYLYYLVSQTVEELEELRLRVKEELGDNYWSSTKYHFLIKAHAPYGGLRHTMLTIYLQAEIFWP